VNPRPRNGEEQDLPCYDNTRLYLKVGLIGNLRRLYIKYPYIETATAALAAYPTEHYIFNRKLIAYRNR
jgi:hypothetical protein